MFTLDYPTECTVCKEIIPPDHIVKSLPFCGHISHQPCIDTWLQTNKTCPECLTPASDQ